MRRVPEVSVVIATYNRSRVLRHAIGSVLESTFSDWELVVVGDCCTDDTEEVVASFADERIRFVNLTERVGHQSGPNNRGLALARGRYVAFLNHDDLYLPGHLATCTGELDRGEADLVWAPAAAVRKAPGGRAGREGLTFDLIGVPPQGGYTPFPFYIASSWMFRRELASSVGPWSGARSTWVTPSQAWLFRAWRSGARLRFVRRVGVMVILSGERSGSYAERESPDHELLVEWMREDPAFRERVLEEAAIRAAEAAISERYHAPGKAMLRALASPLYSLLTAAGIHPVTLNMALRHGRKGSFIRYHRRLTGAR